MIRSLYLILINYCIVFLPASPSCTGGDSLGHTSYFDPILYNGRRYMLNLPQNVHGHPFYRTEEFQPGYVIIRDKKIEGLLLNFDIQRQELVLKYTNLYNSSDYIMLSKAWLEAFQIRNEKFILLKSPGEQDRFFREIGLDSLRILISWEKNLNLSAQVGNTDHYFSEPVKTMYLFRDGELSRFRNNRDFVRLFPEEEGTNLRAYLAEHRLKLKKASDESILNLMSFINRKKN